MPIGTHGCDNHHAPRVQKDNMKKPPTPGDVLRSWRRHQGMTQAQLARLTMSATSTISRMETGAIDVADWVWAGLGMPNPPAGMAPSTNVNPRERERRQTRAVTMLLSPEAFKVWQGWQERRENASARISAMMTSAPRVLDAEGGHLPHFLIRLPVSASALPRIIEEKSGEGWIADSRIGPKTILLCAPQNADSLVSFYKNEERE